VGRRREEEGGGTRWKIRKKRTSGEKESERQKFTERAVVRRGENKVANETKTKGKRGRRRGVEGMRRKTKKAKKQKVGRDEGFSTEGRK